MKEYFNFVIIPESESKRDRMIRKQEESYNEKTTQNAQEHIYGDSGLTTNIYVQLDKTKELMHEYKDALVEKFGQKEGESKYNNLFLDNGKIDEDIAIRRIYNAVNYSISYGASGKDITNEFFKGIKSEGIFEQKKESSVEVSNNAMECVRKAVQQAIPNLPSRFVDEITNDYKLHKNHMVSLHSESFEISKTSRDDQIRFIKENLDTMSTYGQRFRECVSQVKTLNNLEKIIYSPIIATLGVVKVLGGQSAIMKLDDAVDAIPNKFQKLIEKVSTATDSIKNDAKGFFNIDLISDKIKSLREDKSLPKLKNRFDL